MRSRPQKQIEQDIETEDDDIAVEVKDEGSSVSASKKNTALIIVASVILVFVCYLVFDVWNLKIRYFDVNSGRSSVTFYYLILIQTRPIPFSAGYPESPKVVWGLW